MSDAEDRLAAFWHETEAPSRDLVFELNVEQTIARRRLIIDLSGVGVGALAAGGLLAVLWPGFIAGAGGLISTYDAIGPVLAAAAGIGGAMLWFGRTPDEA
jgi:hypothetical protein